MYPDDLADSRRHLALFLMQYWGGPPTYGEERGHPRLRLRHAPHVVDAARARRVAHAHARRARRRWRSTKTTARRCRDYLEMAANQLRNT